MDLRHLEYFVAVAEELSFTVAAHRLHVVQSAVSAGIRVLERELAVELFSRTGRQVRLTGAGTSLLPEARAALAAAQAVRDLVEDLRGGLRGVVRVGTDGLVPVPVLDLADLFASFHASHPRVSITLEWSAAGSPALASRILDGQLDVAFLTRPAHARDDQPATRLATVPLMFVCHAGHPLATAEPTSLTALAHEPFIDFPRGTGVRESVDHAFAVADVRRLSLFEVPDAVTAIELVRRGLGLACVPAEPADVLRGLSHVAVSDADLALDVCLHTATTGLSPAARAFIAEAGERLRTGSSDADVQ